MASISAEDARKALVNICASSLTHGVNRIQTEKDLQMLLYRMSSDPALHVHRIAGTKDVLRELNSKHVNIGMYTHKLVDLSRR